MTLTVAIPAEWVERWCVDTDPLFGKAAWGIARWWHFERQGRRCGCCGSKNEAKWVLDHCHTTGRLRGTVCVSCNVLLGKYEGGHKCVLRWPDAVKGMIATYLMPKMAS